MKEIVGDLWALHAKGNWIVIPTNGIVNKDGHAVMGRGLALQAKERFKGFPIILGAALKLQGNAPFWWTAEKLITMPVKHHWREQATPLLIRKSAAALMKMRRFVTQEPIYLPRPGCGNGGLRWEAVRPYIVDVLDDNFTVVEYEGEQT